MVYLNFPSSLTEEEKLLKKKYEQLRLLQNQLKAPKQEPPPKTPLKRSLEVKPDAKEVAKKLLQSGAISAIKIENKERQGFKRSIALERKRTAGRGQRASFSGYKSFSTSPTLDNPLSIGSSSDSVSPAHGSPRPPVKNLCENFVSSGKLEDEIKENCARQNQRREQERTGWTETPHQGNTVYVQGYGVSKELLEKAFESVGNIRNISVETSKTYGYVTFEKVEQADKAIKTVNKTVVNGVRLCVLPKRQPLMPPLGKDSLSLSLH